MFEIYKYYYVVYLPAGPLSIECLNIAYKSSFSENICLVPSIVFHRLSLYVHQFPRLLFFCSFPNTSRSTEMLNLTDFQILVVFYILKTLVSQFFW